MALPEYGRSIQNMVDYAVTIEDRGERQWCANTIIDIMGNMYPHYRDVPEFKHKLWDHLALMSDFKLDIDYPYEVMREDKLHVKPNQIPYSNAKMHFRHYGTLLEDLVKVAVDMPEGNEKDNLIALICNHMRKDYMTWNKDGMDDEKLANDLLTLSDGKLKLTDKILELMYDRINMYCRPKSNYQSNQNKQNFKNNKRNRS